ncbi:MAG TPA: V4R domain-containing protein [Gemmatimonadaceae bacterium]|nr:V4R domain-containing protein [Gemmatimonadaceae bacterium]
MSIVHTYPGHPLLSLSPASLHALRGALAADLGSAAAGYLQEAGYVTGVELLGAFRGWLHEREDATPEELPMADFSQLLGAFFEELGWGELRVEAVGGAVSAVDARNLAEAQPEAALAQAGCFMTSGVLAGFLGTLAGEPLAVLEVECRSAGHERCRFLVGGAAAMDHVFDEMQHGVTYLEAASATV